MSKAVITESKICNVWPSRRIEGQVREFTRNHLKHCAASAIRAGEPEADEMYDELVDLMYKHNR